MLHDAGGCKSNVVLILGIVFVSYDNAIFTPEQIAEHEYVEANFDTEAVQKAKKEILDKMPAEEYNKAIEHLRKAYEGIIRDEAGLQKELVCNILSGIYSDAKAYADTAAAFWAQDERHSLGYEVARYAESTDAGGNADVIDAAGYGESSTAGVAYALNDGFWHPDLSKRNLDRLMQRIKNEAKTSNNIITDKTKWTFANFSGLDVFAIYSTEKIEKPTLLYESKGARASFERDILLDILEVKKRGKSINGKSSFADRISVRDWLRNRGGIQNGTGALGRGSGTGDAGVLPRQSRRKPSKAFANVVENIFEVQRDEVNKVSYSLDVYENDAAELTPERS